MEAVIKSLNCETCDYLDEMLGDEWRDERSIVHEDGVKMCDVVVNLTKVTIETDEDNVWLCKGSEYLASLRAIDFLEIIVR